LVFDGFEIRNSTDNTVHIDFSHHITLRNLYVHDAGLDGDVLKVNQSQAITIERSEFARPGRRTTTGNPYQECIDLLDVDDAVLRDSWVHDGGSILMYVKGGSRNAVIERNLFSQQRTGATDPAVGLGGVSDLALLAGERYEAINVVFRNNIVMNAVEGALGVYDVQGGYIANNLFINNNRAIVDFRQGNGPAGGSTDVRFASNLVVDTRGTMPTPYIRTSHTVSTFSTTHNTFWNAGRNVPIVGLLNVTTQPGYLGTNPLVTPPAATATLATAIATARPASGSSAAGTGSDTRTAPFFVTLDITGTSRTRLDRGPYALVASTPTTARVTLVSFSVTPSRGRINRSTTIVASSVGSPTPHYRFWTVDPTGTWTLACGDYAPRNMCSFIPRTTGQWYLAVSARHSTSTAQYEATTNPVPYTVTR
jgi:hypothetical protein